ncbi:hypothetical protein LguiA_008597 [Lonicera macranthoides]
MASSKVMASTSPTNPDLPRISDLQTDQSKNFGSIGSMNMDELLKNIYSDPEPFPADAVAAGNGSVDGSFSLPKNVGNKSVDEVWNDIVAGGSRDHAPAPGMTLEDFLTKAGAVREEEVRMTEIPPAPAGFGVDPMVNASQFQATPGFCVESVGFGNENVSVVPASGGGVGGRGKRRVVEEPPVDKATQQKQRRMIKNRESAARSRERKQAYTIELESLVTQLEEENARLLKEEAEEIKERFKELMKNLIPVVEERRPARALRRTHSM